MKRSPSTPNEKPNPLEEAAMQAGDRAMARLSQATDDIPQETTDSSLLPSSPMYNPIARAMARHPSLTREEAEKMAELFGF